MVKKNLKSKNLPLVLVVIDGWGVGKHNQANAIELAKTPVMDGLIKKYSSTTLEAAGASVGLPPNQAGNSEAGHMNLGAGRVVEQDAVTISRSINTGTFFKNPAFEAASNHVKKNKSQLHLMGLLSDGNSGHSEPDHLLALLSWTRQKKIKNVYLHLFTDGRDSSPHSALKLTEALMRNLKNSEKNGKRSGEWIATIIGRFYAMDRKKDWERTKQAYDAMTLGKGRFAKSPQAAITQSYNRGESDEYIQPYVIKRGGKPIAKIKDDDALIFFNLRSDRARQLSKPFVQKDFNNLNKGSFKRKSVLQNLCFVALTDFGPDLGNILTAYPSIDIENTLPVALKKFRQLYIAEKEKYAHITYFFNGGYSDPVDGENWLMVPSPDVASYDKTPAMGMADVTKTILKNLNKYDFIAANLSGPDMIAHTGNLKAGIRACEITDKCIGKIKTAVMKNNGVLLVTADHGNAEKMLDVATDEMYTEHTANPVPFILIEPKMAKKRLKKGKLADVAPTILKILGVPKPREMKGKPLF